MNMLRLWGVTVFSLLTYPAIVLQSALKTTPESPSALSDDVKVACTLRVRKSHCRISGAGPRGPRSVTIDPPFATASVLLSGLNASVRLSPAPLYGRGIVFPVLTSHSLAWSKAPEAAIVVPSGLKSMLYISDVFALKVACSLPVSTSHSLSVLSLLKEASVLLSGPKAILYM